MYEIELQQNPITHKWMVLVPRKYATSRAKKSSKAKKRWLLQQKWYCLKEGEIRPLWLWG